MQVTRKKEIKSKKQRNQKIPQEREGFLRWLERTPCGQSSKALFLLDSSKAREQLGWQDFLSFESAVEWTAFWYQNFDSTGPRELSFSQIKAFLALKSSAD